MRPQRFNGRIGSLADPTVVVRGADGSEVTALLRGINAKTLKMLSPGDSVTIFGRRGDTDVEVTGIVQYQD